MKNAKELTQEVTRIRQRAKELSGFWISELAAALYAIEWATGKRERPPSADIGSAGGEHGKIADRLLHAVSAGAGTAPKKGPKRIEAAPVPRQSSRGRPSPRPSAPGSVRPSPRPSPRRGEGGKKK